MGYLDTYYYLPFGGGPRTCIGMRLALIEMKLATVHLLQKLKFKTSSKTHVSIIFILILKSHSVGGGGASVRFMRLKSTRHMLRERLYNSYDFASQTFVYNSILIAGHKFNCTVRDFICP